MLDESRVPGAVLEASEGLVAQLLRLERAEEPEQIRQIVKKLIYRLQAPEYLVLRRAFTGMAGRVIFKRSEITENIPEFQDLQKVDAMLEERAAQWKSEYIRQGVIPGKAEGLSLALQELLKIRFGKLPATVLASLAQASDTDALRMLMRSAYQAESLQVFMKQLPSVDKKVM